MKEEDVKFPNHPHPLFPINTSLLKCTMCFLEANSSESNIYKCATCVDIFHEECLEFPLELKHPYHPLHSLSLNPLDLDLTQRSRPCNFCGEKLDHGWVYKCVVCEFFMHLRCAKEPPILEVDHSKSHEHKLFLLPKLRPFTCDACGLISDHSTVPWACLQCGVLLHRECIDLPRVIRISRHQHRIAFISSDQEGSCGVCRKVVDSRHGAYTCSKDCNYVVHSKCATREDVWDGIDLEGEPEEPEDMEPSFEIVDDNVIRHFSHKHHLELKDDITSSSDGSEYCQACALPIRIHNGNLYECRKSDCNFVIHETCANLPRKIWYMLHPHRLNLVTMRKSAKSCSVCGNPFCGFIYECPKKGCHFTIDLHCASVSEPFIHNGHPHPLFSPLITRKLQTCSYCRTNTVSSKMMECIECDFVLCFRCITLPSTVNYKHDRHPLVLGNGEADEDDISTTWWCEICERKMNLRKLYYTCDNCCVTVHVKCVLGKHRNLIPGHFSRLWDDWFTVGANNSCCRPFCNNCNRRCPFPTVLERDGLVFCAGACLSTFFYEG